MRQFASKIQLPTYTCSLTATRFPTLCAINNNRRIESQINFHKYMPLSYIPVPSLNQYAPFRPQIFENALKLIEIIINFVEIAPVYYNAT